MFDNAGERLKKFAKIWVIGGIILSVASGLGTMISGGSGGMLSMLLGGAMDSEFGDFFGPMMTFALESEYGGNFENPFVAIGILSGLIQMIIKAFVFWISGLAIYALGEIAENSEQIKTQNRRTRDEIGRTEVNYSSKAVSSAKVYSPGMIVNASAKYEVKCEVCGRMVESLPCKYCEAGVEPFQISAVPAKAEKVGKEIVCPVCNKMQDETNTRCISCGQEFTNNHSGIPFWCGNCGQPGPYEKFCPKCGGSIKRYNR